MYDQADHYEFLEELRHYYPDYGDTGEDELMELIRDNA